MDSRTPDFSIPTLPGCQRLPLIFSALDPSCNYTILKGRWPHRGPGGRFNSMDEMKRYETHVDGLFKQGIFPDVEGLFGGEIILGCWPKKYSNMNGILQDVAPSEC